MSLPKHEVELLRRLKSTERNVRVRVLHEAGWTLAAIGAAFDPPRGRSTVRSWATAPLPDPVPSLPPLPSPFLSSSPSSSASASASSADSDSTFVKAGKSQVSSSPQHAERSTRERRDPFDPAHPRISPDDLVRIHYLAPLARRYRARSNPHGLYAQANAELTVLSRRLYGEGVGVRELSVAADVTYNAMKRRIFT